MYMQGAPSQYETFDYAPGLAESSGKAKNLMAPAFPFTKSGSSGLPISDSLPQSARNAPTTCMPDERHDHRQPGSSHRDHRVAPAAPTFVRPSMGSWVVYGLGAENQHLPGFITINPAGQGGAQNFGSAFLPASYEGTPYLHPRRQTAQHRQP